MTLWIIVGQEQSGDEDDNVSPLEAFGPFVSRLAAQGWLNTAPTFRGEILELRKLASWQR